MKRIYCKKSDLNAVLTAETKKQRAKNTFVNISIKNYRGRKYSPDYIAVKIG